MTIFEYRAINASGELFVGKMEAGTPQDVLEQLERTGITPISATAKDEAERKDWRDWFTLDPAPEEITGFTLDLAMLLKGGVQLDQALLILTQMETRRWLVRLIEKLHVEISGGTSFSVALAAHPALFPPMYVKMMEVAEVSGRLEEALASVAAERQRNERLRKRIISAIAYPAFLAVAALGVLAFVLLYIIPQFEGAIAGFRDRIAPSAQIVFRLSEILRANVDVAIGAVVVLLGAFLAVKQFGSRRRLWIELLSRLPFFRRIVGYHVTLTFCRTLHILVDNGIDVSSALRLIKGVMPLAAAADSLDVVIGDVRDGKRLSDALARHSFVPAHVVQILRVGEESRKIAASAERIAGFYELKLDTALGRMTAIIGPVMMLGVSVIIGWLILSIMSALMSINDLLV